MTSLAERLPSSTQENVRMMQKREVRATALATLISLISMGCAEAGEEPGTETDVADQRNQSLDEASLADAEQTVVRIVSRQTAKCLDVAGGGSANGTNIQLWECSDARAQSFRVEPWDGGLRLVELGSGKCMDVAGGSTENGANVQLWECNGSAAQAFYSTEVGDGFVSLTNSGSGKALDVAAWGTSNGSNIQQWEFGGGDNQSWTLERIGTEDPSTTDPVTGPVTLRVMSLNVWGYKTMPQEAPAYATLIKSQNVDVVGIQEGANDWQLSTAMPTDYSRAEALGAALGGCFERRYQVFVNVCRGNSIVGNERFDLSNGPNATRTGEAVTLRKGGKTFGFIDVHWDHQDANVNRANARETAARANGFAGTPVVVVGDFNTSCTGSNVEVMRTGASLRLDAKASIDCIFSRGTIRQTGFSTAGGPSDHPTVVAELTL
jgi:hypothetical protein